MKKEHRIEKYVLMHKDTEVLIADYNHDTKAFKKISVIKDLDHAPLAFKNYYKNKRDMREFLTKWYKSRTIPFWRDEVNLLLKRAKVENSDELLNNSYALSLSDHYWLKPYNYKEKYENINFFENDFSFINNVNFLFYNGNSKINVNTPDNTTIGKQKKAWTITKETRYLLKAPFKDHKVEPFNEVLASIICQKLGFNHVKYSLKIINGNLVTKCPCFVGINTEFVPASHILNVYIDEINIGDVDFYESYIKDLEYKGIENAREKVENMVLLDYLLVNEDRHFNNFGIIRDADTLKWLDVAPIFDSGESLNNFNYDIDNIDNELGRFFSEFWPFKTFLNHIRDINRFNMRKLRWVPREFGKLLYRYQKITGMTSEEIESKKKLLISRINNVKKKQKEAKKCKK